MDHLITVGEADPILNEIESFLAGAVPMTIVWEDLATVLAIECATPAGDHPSVAWASLDPLKTTATGSYAHGSTSAGLTTRTRDGGAPNFSEPDQDTARSGAGRLTIPPCRTRSALDR